MPAWTHQTRGLELGDARGHHAAPEADLLGQQGLGHPGGVRIAARTAARLSIRSAGTRVLLG